MKSGVRSSWFVVRKRRTNLFSSRITNHESRGTNPEARTTKTFFAKTTVLWVMMTLLQSALAETIKTATESSPITATISQSEPTRIQVLGDRIQNVIHKTGVFSLQENQTAGEIFITPALTGAPARPINLYVLTEKGRTYTLILSPKDIPASSVVLNPGVDNNPDASAWEHQTPWQQSVVNLLKAMRQGKLPPGFVREVQASKLKLWEGVDFIQLETIRGHQLQGEIYQLENKTVENLPLEESRFYRAGVVAVTLEHHTVPAKGNTLVFVVSSRTTNPELRGTSS